MARPDSIQRKEPAPVPQDLSAAGHGACLGCRTSVRQNGTRRVSAPVQLLQCNSPAPSGQPSRGVSIVFGSACLIADEQYLETPVPSLFRHVSLPGFAPLSACWTVTSSSAGTGTSHPAVTGRPQAVLHSKHVDDPLTPVTGTRSPETRSPPVAQATCQERRFAPKQTPRTAGLFGKTTE
jgi:hypothetical protein